MSGTQEHAGAQPAEEYVPTNVLSSEDEPGAQPQPKPEGDPPREGEQPKPGEGEEPKPDPETEARKERANEARRIAALVRQRTEERVARQDAERRIAELTERLQRLENPGQAQQPDIERLVAERLEQRTTEVLAQREEQARVQTFHGAGAAAFPDWQSRCTDLMEMGADPGFAQILVDMGADGAKVAGDLVDNPAEVQRIAQMPTERQRAVALGQYAAKLTTQRATPPPAAPRSSMPPPIRPPSSARARPEPSPEGTMDEYLRWSEKQTWRR
jgi:hypothetical protein